MTRFDGAEQTSDDLFGLANSETDADHDLLEKWLRLAQAALKNKDHKNDAEKDKELSR
jgi:hypothetical protein